VRDKGHQGGRTLTVLLALAANFGVGVLKLIAGLITGSGALLFEAAHSVGDCATEVLLSPRAAALGASGRSHTPVRLRQGALLLVIACGRCDLPC
jgi:Co/Zn/Cd efflux system component